MITVPIDEVLPPRAAALAREEHGLQAHHVSELGLAHTDDAVIAADPEPFPGQHWLR